MSHQITTPSHYPSCWKPLGSSLTSRISGWKAEHLDVVSRSEHNRIVAKNEAQWRKCLRESYEALSAMRNDLNEIIGDMASQESTLADGPTMAAECAAVVKGVSRAFAKKDAQLHRALELTES